MLCSQWLEILSFIFETVFCKWLWSMGWGLGVLAYALYQLPKPTLLAGMASWPLTSQLAGARDPLFPLSPGPHCCFCLWWGLGVPAGRLRDVLRLCRVTVLNIMVAISAPGWQLCGIFSKWPGEVGSLARSILSTSWCGGLPGTPLSTGMGAVWLDP